MVRRLPAASRRRSPFGLRGRLLSPRLRPTRSIRVRRHVGQSRWMVCRLRRRGRRTGHHCRRRRPRSPAATRLPHVATTMPMRMSQSTRSGISCHRATTTLRLIAPPIGSGPTATTISDRTAKLGQSRMAPTAILRTPTITTSRRCRHLLRFRQRCVRRRKRTLRPIILLPMTDGRRLLRRLRAHPRHLHRRRWALPVSGRPHRGRLCRPCLRLHCRSIHRPGRRHI